MEDKCYEVCPHCGEEVELDAELKVQTCPNCGMRIVTCSMCQPCDEPDNQYCVNCCLCRQAELENEDEGNKVNRYVMSWSQADRAWMVVYAPSYEDAVRKFEDGDYKLEIDNQFCSS